MRFSTLILPAVLLGQAVALGFTTYKQITEGSDNSDAIAYSELDRSDALFLYIQIIADADHTPIINDFKTLSQNYGSQGIKVVPRVRYGNSDGSIATEPSDENTIMNDVSTWASIFSDVSQTIEIPVVQAGFLGQWGEWHDGPFCQAQGSDDSSENQRVKAAIVNSLLTSGQKVAIRYPRDHAALFNGNRTVTLHDDCIFDDGAGGTDGGTFPSGDDRQTWVDYTKQVASDNTFGGEGCDDAGDAGYDWTDWAALCGSGGLIDYINAFHIAYLNPSNPEGLQDLFNDPDQRDCSDAIQQALEQYS